MRIFVGFMKKTYQKLRNWLRGLSFRTGLFVLAACVVCYIVSFAQMLLPISIAAKGILWTIFFGLAKACQYSALLILGKEGVRRIKARIARGRGR